MIPLVESFYNPDESNVSAIGNSYGDIYNLQLAWSKESKLNETKRPKYYKELMEPILKSKL